MKKSAYIAFLAGFLFLASFSGGALKTSVYKIDVSKSTVEWSGEKKNGKHNGTLLFSGGEITVSKKEMLGHAEIDMTTLKDLDVTDEGSRTKLETQLRSASFFDVEKFPKASFVITSIVKAKAVMEISHVVTGNLTIRDKTEKVSFNAVINMEGDEFTCDGTIPVDHVKFNIAPDNKYMKDTFDVKVHIFATK